MDFLKFGFETDIGSSRCNQDRCFVWRNDDKQLYVFGVADGHGRLGELVADTVKNMMMEFLDQGELCVDTNVPDFLEKCFDRFQEKLQSLLEEFGAFDGKTGGTTLSIAVIANNILFVANVADSSIILCAREKKLQQTMVKHVRDCAEPLTEQLLVKSAEEPSMQTLELTSNHSADCVKEYKRMLRTHPSKSNPNVPELRFLYDAHHIPKRLCKPIFNLSETFEPILDPSGVYYKNVCRDWGTIVVPTTDDVHLAFTRSLGDFFFNSLGVSAKPEIQSIDLNELAERLEDQLVCVVAATDGLWDNWLPEHVGKFVLDPSCIEAVKTKPDIGALRVAQSLMNRNTMYGKRNFGVNNLDNTTVVLAYIDLRCILK
jgi:serine/threonine protein phosphatase PrpC